MSALDDIRRALRNMWAKPIYSGPPVLFVSKDVFDLGEDECRRVCDVGADVEIVEYVSMMRSGETLPLPRVYLSALRRAES